MSTLHVFDMDGTLYDTQEANKRAYEEAGLPEYKEEYHCRTAADWGCPAEIHQKKNEIFVKYSHLISPTWAMPFYEIAEMTNRAIVLTGASAGSVRIIEKMHGRPFPAPFGITLSEARKRSALWQLCEVGWDVVYYDDNVDMGRRVTTFATRDGSIKLITPGGIK